MMMLNPRLLVAIVLLWAVTVAVQSRPATDFGEPEIEESVELSPDPSIVMVPVRQLMDPNSPLVRILNNQTMSEQNLQAIETGLTGIKTETAFNNDEMMMGDMPSADDPQDSLSPATTFERDTVMPDNYSDEMSHREKNRTLRIQTIHEKLLNFLGRNYLPPSLMIKTDPSPVIPIQQRDAIRIFYKNMNNFPFYPSDTFTEKTQSFYPICDVLSKHTNKKDSMNLMFNISLPKSTKGIKVNVNIARLRLYKQLVSDYSQTSDFNDPQTSESTLLVESTDKTKTNLSTAGVVPIKMDKRQIRVSIYMYTKSIDRKIKSKLLDSRMVPYYSEEWTEWNIHNAVQFWYGNPVRNYGIRVEVEDEDGNLLPVNKFFRTMNCSGDAQMMTSKPVQGFLMEAVQNDYGNKTSTTNNSNTNTDDAIPFKFNMHLYPIIDVTTVEVSESKANNAMLSQYAKDAFEQVGGRGVV